ncbi:MAG: periplasmic heavy metal sensor [Proteobacteria bacterium]|nr:periplasmic heavy metal sensor [Pseudomonadota bacterium]
MTGARTAIAVVLLTIVAAAAGVWAGMEAGGRHGHQHAAGFHDILHHELGLTPDQEERIASMEAKFALDRKDLEMRMRAANLELARALENERTYGAAAKTAISHFHEAMAALQELTILHVLEMRAVLTPEQAEHFDTTIRQALSADPP